MAKLPNESMSQEDKEWYDKEADRCEQEHLDFLDGCGNFALKNKLGQHRTDSDGKEKTTDSEAGSGNDEATG